MNKYLFSVVLLVLLRSKLLVAEKTNEPILADDSEPAAADEFPFMAYVEYKPWSWPWPVLGLPWPLKSKPVKGHTCTGTIISEEWVLTAAGCVELAKRSRLSVRVGSVFSDAGTVHQVVAKMLHPFYLSSGFGGWLTNYYHNVALLRVEPKFKLNFKLEAIPISKMKAKKYIGEEATYAAWGGMFERFKGVPYRWQEASHQLRKRTVTLADNNMVLVKPYENEFTLQANTKYNTMGDLGAPLFVDQNGRMTQIGIQSQADFGPPTFVDVGVVSDWIALCTGI